MTKFIACKCPNCGANVKVDSNLDKATCKYCDADIIVERDMDQEIKKTINEQLKTNSKIAKIMLPIFLVYSLLLQVLLFSLLLKALAIMVYQRVLLILH